MKDTHARWASYYYFLRDIDTRRITWVKFFMLYEQHKNIVEQQNARLTTGNNGR